jgi:hypothetical protein
MDLLLVRAARRRARTIIAHGENGEQFPLIRRSHQPVADLDERLGRVFVMLTRARVDDRRRARRTGKR